MFKLPAIVVNFKTYPEATGKNAVKMAKIMQKVAKKYKVTIAVCPQHADVFRVAKEVKIPVFAQHVDPMKPGRNTGWVIPETMKAAGAIGTLINHSEHKLPLEVVRSTIEAARNAGLVTICCTADIEESRKVAEFSPDIIAIEPPELIGTGIPVSKAKPEIVAGAVEEIKKVNPNVEVLCGAGITTGEDVVKAIELGTKGVLVASGIVCAKDPRAAIEDMVRAVSGKF
ncbi:MAG: triose-phosphate isomerase [Candidatus Hadarchaeales archaeon]